MTSPPATSTSSGEHSAGPTVVRVQHLPKPYATPPLRPSLPIGVAVFAVLLAIVALIVLLAGALVLLNTFLGSSVVPTSLFITTNIDPWGAAIFVVLGAALLALARALWDLELWSLWVTVGLVFLGQAYLFFTGSLTVAFLVLLVLFVYLLSVRHHFY
jgi:hypothetical protein